MTTIKKYKVCSLIFSHVLNIVFVRLNSSVVCKWGCCVSFSRWKERGACLHWPGNGAYPARAQASPGLRSLWALPNKSGETAGCQHSYRPSLSPPVAHPFGLQFAQFIAPVYLAQSAISARRLQWKNGEARVSQPCLNAKRGEKKWKSWHSCWSNCTSPRLHLFSRGGEKKKRKRSLNLPSGLDYFCCGCQISGNTFIWHTLISGQIHDIRPCIVRTELCTSVQLSEIQTSAGPRRPKRSLHPFPTVQIRVFLSPLEDTLNYVWLR